MIDDRRFTEHFPVSELACHDGTPVPRKYYFNAEAICQRAEVLRAAICEIEGRDVPLHVDSGYRSPTWNKFKDGVAHSQHLVAGALDLRPLAEGWSSDRLATLYEKLIAEGKVPDGGVGRYDDPFVHIDIGPARRWDWRHRKG